MFEKGSPSGTPNYEIQTGGSPLPPLLSEVKTHKKSSRVEGVISEMAYKQPSLMCVCLMEI